MTEWISTSLTVFKLNSGCFSIDKNSWLMEISDTRYMGIEECQRFYSGQDRAYLTHPVSNGAEREKRENQGEQRTANITAATYLLHIVDSADTLRL